MSIFTLLHDASSLKSQKFNSRQKWQMILNWLNALYSINYTNQPSCKIAQLKNNLKFDLNCFCSILL